VRASRAIHYLAGEDTATARMFVADIVSTDLHGIWVQAAKEHMDEDEKTDPTRLFVRWASIIAIQTSPYFSSKRTKAGFVSS
jgi:hypothetical protein